MRRVGIVVLSAVVLLVTAFLPGCASLPTTGALSVSMGGLPQGVDGAVVVAGSGFTKTVAATTTLIGLPPGT